MHPWCFVACLRLPSAAIASPQTYTGSHQCSTVNSSAVYSKPGKQSKQSLSAATYTSTISLEVVSWYFEPANLNHTARIKSCWNKSPQIILKSNPTLLQSDHCQSTNLHLASTQINQSKSQQILRNQISWIRQNIKSLESNQQWITK